MQCVVHRQRRENFTCICSVWVATSLLKSLKEGRVAHAEAEALSIMNSWQQDALQHVSHTVSNDTGRISHQT